MSEPAKPQGSKFHWRDVKFWAAVGLCCFWVVAGLYVPEAQSKAFFMAVMFGSVAMFYYLGDPDVTT